MNRNLLVVGFKHMGLQSGIKCSAWLNVSHIMRQEIPDRRSSIEERVMSRCFGLNLWNAYSSCVKGGAELS